MKNVLNLASNSAKCQFVKCLFAYVRWHKSHKSTSFSSESSFPHFLHLFMFFVFVLKLKISQTVTSANSTCILKGCCEDFVCYHSKNSRTGTAGEEPSWKRWQRLENVHMKLAETASSSSSRDFDLFAHKRSTWCKASTSVRWQSYSLHWIHVPSVIFLFLMFWICLLSIRLEQKK